jgi:hypothetical protein
MGAYRIAEEKQARAAVMQEKLTFATNVPQVLALRYLTGKRYDSKFGSGVQQLFSTTDDRCFYVADSVGDILAQQFAALGVAAGEHVEICKRQVTTERGGSAIRWQVSRPGELRANVGPVKRSVQSEAPAPLGERPNGTFAIAAPAPRPDVAPTPAPAIAAAPQWTSVLLEQTNAVVDVFAAAVASASAKHGGLVKPETVQSLLTTLLINMSKNSSMGPR